MNNNGQTIFFTFMIGLTILVLALALAFPVKEIVDNATNYSESATGNQQTLDCANDSISTYDKGACLITDMSMFYFIGGLIFLVGSVLAAKILL